VVSMATRGKRKLNTTGWNAVDLAFSM